MKIVAMLALGICSLMVSGKSFAAFECSNGSLVRKVEVFSRTWPSTTASGRTRMLTLISATPIHRGEFRIRCAFVDASQKKTDQRALRRNGT